MKVLVLQSELGVLRGGGENFTRNLFAAFAERGHHVTAAFVADRQAKYPLSLPPGILPVPVPGWWSMNLGQATLASIGRYIPAGSHSKRLWDRLQQSVSWRTIRWHRGRFQRRIESEFDHRWKEFDAAYVHSNVPLASKIAHYLPTVLRLPGPVEAEAAPLLRSVQAVCANGDALACIRQFLDDGVIELPVGIDGKRFRPGPSSIRSTLGWTDQHWVVGYVGRLTHLKGVDFLAAAFREASLAVDNLRLLIVGSGAEERRIRPLLAKELSERIVHIEADVDHGRLAEWYRAMDVLVMPSRYENFSNAMLEGMACGIPFLASDVGGNRTLAETGAGWLFAPECVASFRTCLSQVLENRAEVKARGEIGRRYVTENHDWVTSAKRLEQIMASRLKVGV